METQSDLGDKESLSLGASSEQEILSGPCKVCVALANLRCAVCKIAFYCSREHQKIHWKDHKLVCSPTSQRDNKPAQKEGASTLPHSAYSLPPASAWARGFQSPAKMYEWFVDCYRMRVDDNYAIGGGELSGIYDSDATKDSVVGDFIIFALLSVKNNVLPSDWHWSKFLKEALHLIPYAFEKSDAQKKYGRENVFMGGRSLRLTAEIVYGNSAGGNDCTQFNEMFDMVFKTNDYLANAAIFENIGGVEIWRRFKKLRCLLKRFSQSRQQSSS
jgi:splicing suppressor protein 51